jgi:hypothetical protein
MNKLTRKEHPEMFTEISEMIVKHVKRDHRRGSNFFTVSLVEFKEEYAKYYPTTENFNELVGHWITNEYVSDTEHGTDESEIRELTRVEKKEIVTTKTEWVPVI